MSDDAEAREPDKTLIEGDAHVGAAFSGCTIERKVGQGGMGSVYLARRASDGSEVVVKFLATEQATNQSWRARFVREARMMQSLSHPNIVAVYSVEADVAEPHIVMEYVDGKGLDAVLKKGPIAPLESARIARDIALGLAEAHDRGIIHRDIKPANVLLTHSGEVKILDFGLAKSVQIEDGLSLPGQALGTPNYMAPEQWGEHAVDARCDIYALGVTLYNLVTRALPFEGPNAQSILRKVTAGTFTAPRALKGDIPEDLELVIYRMLAIDRRYRYSSARDVARELDGVIAGKPVDVPRLVAKADGKRTPLLPATSFTLGREPTCEIAVVDRSVSRQHARIAREPAGFVLSDLGSTYGTFVGGMRIKQDVLLKDGDEVTIGKVAFQFNDGGIARTKTTTRRVPAEKFRVTRLPVPFVQALVERSDRRVVVPLLEELAPDTPAAVVQETQELLLPILGGDVAEAVRKKLETQLRRSCARAPAMLFAITRENLGDDLEAWLAFWDNARGSYPGQLGPQVPLPHAQLAIRKGVPEPRTVKLDTGTLFGLGREADSRIQIDSPSVSRNHATILRLHTRFLIRDEGSRFGTLVNGQKVRIAFLSPGDVLLLGKVEIAFEMSPTDLAATGLDADAFAVHSAAFFALEEMKHESVASALVRFLELERREWIDGAAAKLLEGDAKRARDFADAVARSYGTHAAKARELLPGLLGASADSPEGWRKALAKKKPSLPPQLVPAGWFPSHAAPPTSA